MVTWFKISLQNKASPLMNQLIFFHDHTLLILTMIKILGGYLMLMLFLMNLQIDCYYKVKLFN